jgi:hypothetical protein
MQTFGVFVQNLRCHHYTIMITVVAAFSHDESGSSAKNGLANRVRIASMPVSILGGSSDTQGTRSASAVPFCGPSSTFDSRRIKQPSQNVPKGRLRPWM